MEQAFGRAMDQLRRPTRGRKFASNRWKQARSMEGNVQTYPISENEPFHFEIMEKIQDIFQDQDESKKGFITREDMQKLEGDVPWSTEELELLFDGLDADNEGYVTTEDFMAGLRHFLSSQMVTQEHRKRKAVSARIPASLPLVEANMEERKYFKAFINDLGADTLFEDQSEIWRIWVQLRKDEPGLLGNLKEFLAKMTHLIKEAKHAKEMLQLTLEMRVADHNKEVQQLYEEMEQQIEREKQRLQYESKTRSQLYNMEMKKVLSIKEQEIEHFLGIQKELEMQLLTLREKQHMVSTQTQELKQTNSVLENQLHETLCQLQQTQRQLDTMKTKISQMHKEGRAFDDVASMSNADSEPRTRVISIKEDPMANSTGGEQYSPQQPSGQSSLFKELNEAIAALSQATESHQQQIDDLGVQGQELMDQIRQCRNSQKSFVQEKIPPKETVSKNSSLEQKISETLTGKARLQEEVFLKEGLTHIQVNSLERMENNLTVEVKTPDPMPRGSLIPDAQSSVYSGMMTDIGGDYKEGPLPGDTLALEQLNQPEHHKQGLKYSNIIQNEPLSTSLEERVIRLSPEMKMLDKPASKTLHSLAPSHFPLRIALPKVNVGSESKSSFAPNSQLRNMLEPETHAQNSEGLLLSEHGREGKMKECECNKDQEIRAVMDEEVKVSPNHRDCQMNEGTKETSKVTGAACSNPDHLYNVLFVGNTDVGKTSFLCRLQKNSFDANLTATIGIDYRIKNLFVDDKCFTLQLWDTAGQERYHSLTKQFFRKADGVVLMYDITSENSFADVRYWLSCIQEGAGNEVTVLLLGNKTDCTAERRVSIEDGEYLAKEYGFSFYECSAASGYNVNESMVRLVRLLKAREDQLIQEILELPVIPKKKNRCCS